ncbi:hypothetical protein J4233_02810 [Candidatus Pacearchaeota archaeon]|nr:hypothetical protein [Candidatus Pacearchaeota archaeon]
MEKIGWVFIVFGIVLLLAASFGSGPAFSPGQAINPINVTDFQIILAIGGLAAIIVGIQIFFKR